MSGVDEKKQKHASDNKNSSDDEIKTENLHTSKESEDSDTKTFKEFFSDLEKTLENFFVKQLPSLPSAFKESLIQLLPVINLVLLVLSFFGAIFMLLISVFFTSVSLIFPQLSRVPSSLFLPGFIVILFAVYFRFRAINGLSEYKQISWKYLYYAVFIDVVSSLFYQNFVGMIIIPLVSFYFLFQIKSKYKN